MRSSEKAATPARTGYYALCDAQFVALCGAVPQMRASGLLCSASRTALRVVVWVAGKLRHGITGDRVGRHKRRQAPGVDVMPAHWALGVIGLKQATTKENSTVCTAQAAQRSQKLSVPFDRLRTIAV